MSGLPVWGGGGECGWGGSVWGRVYGGGVYFGGVYGGEECMAGECMGGGGIGGGGMVAAELQHGELRHELEYLEYALPVAELVLLQVENAQVRAVEQTAECLRGERGRGGG